MKEVIKYFGLILMGVVTLWSIYNVRVLKLDLKEEKEFIQRLMNKSKMKENILKEAFLIQGYNWILGVDSVRNIPLKNFKNEKLLLHDVLKDTTLLFYFEAGMCEPCVNKELLNLEELAKSHIKNSIIIVGSGFYSNYLFKDEKFEKWQKQIYLGESNIYSTKNLSHTPSLTLVNREGNIMAAYHAIKSSNVNFEIFKKFLTKTLK